MSKSEDPEEVDRRTEEELENLAYKIVNDEIFITNDPDELKIAFGFILGMTTREFETHENWKRYSSTIGAVYEEYNKASPKMVNNVPVFFSANLVHKDDLEILLEIIDDYEEKIDELDPKEGLREIL